MKLLKILCVALLMSVTGWAQLTFLPPTVTTGATNTVSWTAGTVNNGGHPVAVVAGSGTVSLNKTDCTNPLYANCNFVYANSSGTVAVTTTLATAIATGNTLLALIETGAVTSTQTVYPWQSGTLWMAAAGPLAGFSAAPVPASAGGADLGTTALPWANLWLGTAATNNIQINALATSAARKVVLADQGATAALAIADPAVTTKVIAFAANGATAATTLTLADTLTASRTVTFTDPGGAANVAYANPTTAQALSAVSSITSSGTNPATAGVTRLANAESMNWRNAANGADIGLTVNASNFLVYSGSAPTDGYYLVPLGQCGLTLTTGTWAATAAGGTSIGAGPFVLKAASGNSVLVGTSTAATNTFELECDLTPPTRITSGKGVTVNDVEYMFGYQTTALTSIGTAAINTVTYSAAGGAAAGTVASAGGALTVTVGTSHSTPGATTTTGQCYVEKLAFGTPVAMVTDNQRLTLTATFLQSAAAATIMQICGVVVHYTVNNL